MPTTTKMATRPHATPLVPRLHLIELQDQPWFPQWVRERCQAALTITWGTRVPFLTSSSAAGIVASLLQNKIPDLSNWVLMDFCSGAGGPTPQIEAEVNSSLRKKGEEEAMFVLTDIRPHPVEWAGVAKTSPHLMYEEASVDASCMPEGIVGKYALVKKRYGREKPQNWRGRHPMSPIGGERLRLNVFRMFSLAFHHFDDPMARAILKDTVKTSEGFGIFELQDRSFASLIMCTIFLIGIYARAIEFCWLWGSPMTFVFVYLCPIIPFVLYFDGIVSSLRTRTPDEVEALLRSCGEDTSEWEVQSGRELHFWPCGYVSWIVGMKKDVVQNGHGAQNGVQNGAHNGA